MISTIYEDFYKSAMIAPKNAKLVIRHSIRGDIAEGSNGLDVLLTREGERMAEHFGRFCKFDIDRIHSSVVERCLQTSRLIASGYERSMQKKLDILSTEVLASSYITDFALADKLFTTHSPYWIIQRFLMGEHLPGMRDVHECMRILFSYIFSKDSDCMEIFVTHDTFINALVCFCCNIIPQENEYVWPYMLEGAFFYREQNRIYCIFRGKIESIAFDF